MTFASILCEWAATYNPMRHNPSIGNKRVYFTDSYQGMVDFVKEISDKMSPCVVLETDIAGYMVNGRFFRDYPVYFFVKSMPLNGTSSGLNDGEAAAVAKEWALTHAMKFYAWLLDKRNEDHTNADFNGINLDEMIQFMTIGPIHDGWFAVQYTLTRDETVLLCVNETDYVC